MTIGNVLNPKDHSLSLVYSSGVYVLPEAISGTFNGYNISSVRFCGLHDQREDGLILPGSNLATSPSSSPALYLYILILRRLTTDNPVTQFNFRYKPLMVRLNNSNNVCDMDPVTLASLNPETPWTVCEGDRLGVYIPEACINDTALPDSRLCPAYVVVDSKTNESLYYTDDIQDQTIQDTVFNRSDFVVVHSKYLNVEYTLDNGTFNHMWKPM